MAIDGVVVHSMLLGEPIREFRRLRGSRLRHTPRCMLTLSEPLPSCWVSVEPHGILHMAFATAVFALSGT